MIPRQVYVALAVVFALLGLYRYGYHNGYVQKETEDALEIARLNGEMVKQKDAQDAKDAEAKQEFETKLSSVIASRPRLYVPLAPSSRCATAAGNNAETRAELDGQTVEDLIRLVAEGDRAIIELNSCIDRYNAVRETLSGQR